MNLSVLAVSYAFLLFYLSFMIFVSKLQLGYTQVQTQRVNIPKGKKVALLTIYMEGGESPTNIILTQVLYIKFPLLRCRFMNPKECFRLTDQTVKRWPVSIYIMYLCFHEQSIRSHTLYYCREWKILTVI